MVPWKVERLVVDLVLTMVDWSVRGLVVKKEDCWAALLDKLLDVWMADSKVVKWEDKTVQMMAEYLVGMWGGWKGERSGVQ